MNQSHGPYHRTGQPGGPGCPVSHLPIKIKAPNGELLSAYLIAAGDGATELELLRTVAHQVGIQWGKDDLGWWAVALSGEGESEK